jgi:hypothetical protein
LPKIGAAVSARRVGDLAGEDGASGVIARVDVDVDLRKLAPSGRRQKKPGCMAVHGVQKATASSAAFRGCGLHRGTEIGIRRDYMVISH